MRRSFLTFVTLVMLAVPTSPALAADPCNNTGANQVNVSFYGGVTEFRLFLDASLMYQLEYKAGGVTTFDACGLARDPVTNIIVTGDAADNLFILDLGDAGGPPTTATHVNVALAGGIDYFGVGGTDAPDSFRIGHYIPAMGTLTFDRNGDGAPDIDIYETEIVGALVFGGNDTVTGAAGGNFSAAGIPIDIYGGTGNDSLTGGLAIDYIWGESGRDRIWGGRGADRLWGQGGGDRLWGQGGRDRLWGGAGPDRLWGGGGADKLRGGAGQDTCNGGSGSDTQSSCEIGANY